MSSRTIGYWIATGLFCVAMAAGGAADLLRVASVHEILARLGYPIYLATILGVAKLLGVVALLLPGVPRLKEWAYAGFTFDLGGAIASHAFVGDSASVFIAPVVLLLIGTASYLLRPESLRGGSLGG